MEDMLLLLWRHALAASETCFSLTIVEKKDSKCVVVVVFFVFLQLKLELYER